MTSAAAVVGITFRGTDVQIIDGLFLEIVEGLDNIPSVRGRDTVVPGLTGRIPRNRVADRMAIELAGWVRGVATSETTDRDAYRANVLAMQALFDPTEPPGELVATLEDGSTATINARVLPPIVDDQKLPTFKTLSIEMESVDPYWVLVGS